MLADASRALQSAGIDVLVVRSGIHKGTAEWGAKITQEEIDAVQHLVDAQARHFTAAVAKGRGLSAKRVAALADGRVLIGQEAVAAGLVDRLATFEAVAGEAFDRLTANHLHLEGRAAVDKVAQLTAGIGYLAPDAAAWAVERQYPLLAKRARAFHEQEAAAYRERMQAKRRVGM